MTITPQWKDELRARVTLSTVVQRSTKLTKAGREWKACCPFHNENTPSFYVNDEKNGGFYHCFGCGAHGDVITWMIEQRGLGFMDAIKELAEEAGMEVPAPDPQAAKKAEKRAELVDVTTAAQDWFVAQLKSPGGITALDYLRRRDLSDATLREFGFGYAPEDKQALSGALSNFEPQMLAESGMRIVTDDGKAYDRFRGRVMLPIQDQRGRVIAFGGRILDKRDGVAKYLNSPDTPLFDKGRTLYNHHRAAPASRQTGRIVVVEGYMDVVALAQAGFHDVVAPLGTALTEAQLEMLWRLVERPILCFDGDAAGSKAAQRALERASSILRVPNDLAFVKLPEGLDPDDLVAREGAAGFENVLSEAFTLEDFIWETEKSRANLSNASGKAAFRNCLQDWAEKFADKTLARELRQALLSRYFDQTYKKRQFFKGPDYGTINPSNLGQLKRWVEDGSRQVLVSAVFCAVARNPHLIGEFIERIRRINPKGEEVLYAIDVLIVSRDAFETEGVYPREALSEIASWHPKVPLPFLHDEAPEELVRDSVDEALVQVVDIPLAEAAWEAAKLDFEEHFDEHHETVLLESAKALREAQSKIGRVWRQTVKDI
ncbi:MAG: DNA primase [Pseudomonadota bacterium]